MAKKKQEDTDIGVIINDGLTIIAKEVQRLAAASKASKMGLTAEDAMLLTGYLKTLSVINKDTQREDKKVRMDLSSLDGDALDKFIEEQGSEAEEDE